MNTERQDPRFVVCIISTPWKMKRGRGKGLPLSMPVKGEIYEVEATTKFKNKTYLVLVECPGGGYDSTEFRPIDNSFGEITCEFVEQTSLKIAELEEAEKEMV